MVQKLSQNLVLLLEELQLFEEKRVLLAQDLQEGTATFLTIWDKNMGSEFSTGTRHLVLRTPKIKAVLLWSESFVVHFLHSSTFPSSLNP